MEVCELFYGCFERPRERVLPVKGKVFRDFFFALHESAVGVRREKAALSSGCKPRQPLQPEATGAVMEVTKWLKPSDSVSRYTVTARVCRP
jgi:hypothetical protein